MSSLNQICAINLLVPVMAGGLLTLALVPPFIALQRKLQIGQFIRQEGPAEHAAKASTPTMGGVCLWFVTCAVSTALLMVHDALGIDPIAILLTGSYCALLGLIDDLVKYSNRSNAGISAWFRLLAQFAAGIVLGVGLLSMYGPDMAFRQIIGNFHGHIEAAYLVLPAVSYVFLVAFVLAGTCNAVNLHDGLDGLAAGTGWQIFLCLALMLHWTRQPELSLIAAVAAGCVIAFLFYNRFPAKIFMGDVGSLFLGALMAGLAIVGHLVLWFIPLALIYILETLSVIFQIVVFKLTKPYTPDKPFNPLHLFVFKLTHRLPGVGKRIFRMAPLHHHFEALSSERHISEGVVVACFWLAQFVICLIVMCTFYWQFVL